MTCTLRTQLLHPVLSDRSEDPNTGFCGTHQTTVCTSVTTLCGDLNERMRAIDINMDEP